MKTAVGVLVALVGVTVAADIAYGWHRCREERGRLGFRYAAPVCLYPTIGTNEPPPPQRVGFLPWP